MARIQPSRIEEFPMTTGVMQRRLAAILAADVVGYSKLMGLDEAGTHERLKAHRKDFIEPTIAQYEGRIIRLTGDGALVEFASAVQAMRCAVAIQRGMAQRNEAELPERRIDFRIGLNLGDIIVDEGDVYGDGVNIAARLEALAKPGGICVSRTVYSHVRAHTDVIFESQGMQRMKNIIHPVHIYHVHLNNSSKRCYRNSLHLRQNVIATTVVAIVVAVSVGFAAWLRGQSDVPSTQRAGIAILPFDNLAGDEATGRIAYGLTEDIITDLSHFRDLDVIASNTTAAYKDQATDVRRIGEALQVAYVLDGSIRRYDDRIRVTAQLIDAASGAYIWSERWDRPTKDIFAVQGELAEQLAARLGGAFGLGTITSAEVKRVKRRPPRSFTAYEHYLLAVEAEGMRSASGLAHAEKAIALDANLGRAYTVRGWLRYFTIANEDDWKRKIDIVGEDFRRAVALDEDDAEARVALAYYLAEKGQLVAAAAEFQRALEQAPANAHVLAVTATTLPYLGKPEEGVFLADRALRLDPYMSPASLQALKDPYFFAQKFDRVVEIVNAVPEPSRSRLGRLFLTASYAMLGRFDEASASKAVYVESYGERSAEQWLNQGLIFARQRERDLFVSAFRVVGLPVCAKSVARSALSVHLPECERSDAADDGTVTNPIHGR